jgi:hypothetical protein
MSWKGNRILLFETGLCDFASVTTNTSLQQSKSTNWYLLADLTLLWVWFGEMSGNMMVEWEVQAVQPDHRLSTLVTMVVPFPLRRQDHISWLHVDSLSFDSGKAEATFDDKS